ncbi:MAG: hypothetical protein WKF84_25495 [Pyrinomonadaceae bacterium]
MLRRNCSHRIQVNLSCEISFFDSRLALALCTPGAYYAQQQQASAPEIRPSVERLRAHITHLASEKLDGRKTGNGWSRVGRGVCGNRVFALRTKSSC